MSATSEPGVSPPFTQNREFWVLMGYAVALGVFGAFAGLVFMGVIGFGGRWYTDSDPRWFGGQWWWVAVTAGAGVVVGLLRRVMRLPEEVPGLIADLKEGHVEPRLVRGSRSSRPCRWSAAPAWARRRPWARWAAAPAAGSLNDA